MSFCPASHHVEAISQQYGIYFSPHFLYIWSVDNKKYHYFQNMTEMAVRNCNFGFVCTTINDATKYLIVTAEEMTELLLCKEHLGGCAGTRFCSKHISSVEPAELLCKLFCMKSLVKKERDVLLPLLKNNEGAVVQTLHKLKHHLYGVDWYTSIFLPPSA